MAELKVIAPFIGGIQNKFTPTRTPEGMLLEATNVNIGIDGAITPRPGYTFKASDTHSLFEHGANTYAIYQERVCQLFPDTVTILSPNFTVNRRVSWCIVNDEPVFVNNDLIGKITNNTAVIIGIDKPTITGNVEKNKKAYAYAYINTLGEEGPLSAVTSERISGAPLGLSLREYSTGTAIIEGQTVSSDELFLENETSVGGSPLTFGCDKIPGGSYVEYWRGHLLVARGRTLFISKALHYGVYEEDSGVYPFEGTITFLASLESGIFVGVRNVGVYFLKGNTPAQWERILVSTDQAQEGAAVVAASTRIEVEGVSGVVLVAMWFTEFGFAVGLPSGGVVYPQVNNLKGLALGNGSMYYNDGRLTVLY